MDRRSFLVMSLASAFAPTLAAGAETTAKALRIGYLGYASPALERPNVAALRQGLRDLGYVDNQKLTIEFRSADGKLERLADLAAELVALKVDVIVTLATPGALAAKHATATIPIVVAAMADPARDGLVASLARPGANITGLTFLGPELIPKRLGLLKELMPSAARVGVLWHPGVYSERTMTDMLKETESTAQALALRLQLLGAGSPTDFERLFSEAARNHDDALLVFPSPMLYLEYKRIVEFVTRNRLPAVYPWREAVDAGGLIAYGANIADLLRHAAVYVDKIVRGACFLLTSLVIGLGAPLLSAAHAASTTPRVGVTCERSQGDPFVAAFREGLRERGYTEGQNIIVDYRYANAELTRVAPLTTELVRLKIDVLVVGGTESAQLARRVTSTVPIVFATAGDPVAAGLAASLAHPRKQYDGDIERLGGAQCKTTRNTQNGAATASRGWRSSTTRQTPRATPLWVTFATRLARRRSRSTWSRCGNGPISRARSRRP